MSCSSSVKWVLNVEHFETVGVIYELVSLMDEWSGVLGKMNGCFAVSGVTVLLWVLWLQYCLC